MFQEFLTRKEDYLRALRGFLREVVRVIRNEFSFTAFVRSLMQERNEVEFGQLEPAHKVRMDEVQSIYIRMYLYVFICTSIHFIVCVFATGENGSWIGRFDLHIQHAHCKYVDKRSIQWL